MGDYGGMSVDLPWYKRRGPLAASQKSRAAKVGSKKKAPRVMKPRTYRPIHLGTVVVLVFVLLVATGVAGWLMWDAARIPASFPNSPDLAVRKAQLRVDVIRNILAVSAGTGGLMALVLAARRQYVKERVDHDDQEHKNRTAEDAKYDAAERRLTDLYIKAAEQLGSDKAPVRLASLLSLERIGDNHPEHRQNVVDLLCAYLRMPYDHPTNEVWDPQLLSPEQLPVEEAKYNEREVRRIAQDIISRKLGPVVMVDGKAIAPDDVWSDIALDLTGAVLVDFDLSYCSVDSATFTNATFYGHTNFASAVINGVANFIDAEFRKPVEFDNARFGGVTGFNRATFARDASFKGARFSKIAMFGRAVFEGRADFSDAKFEDSLSFSLVEASLDHVHEHEWPEGFEFLRSGSRSGKRGSVRKVMKVVRGNDADANSAVPQQPTDRGPVNPQPSPDPEG